MRKLIFSCSSEGIDEIFYEKLIKKLLSTKLNKIELDIQEKLKLELNYSSKSEVYTREKKKKIYPGRNWKNNNNIIIYKLKLDGNL